MRDANQPLISATVTRGSGRGISCCDSSAGVAATRPAPQARQLWFPFDQTETMTKWIAAEGRRSVFFVLKQLFHLGPGIHGLL